jgi:ankyrin repeat protein/beta-lactamase regulating signal transducer with metallopeptidase domain
MTGELFLQDLSLWDCVWQSTIFLAVGLMAGRRLRHRPSRAYAALLLAMMAAALVPFLSAVIRHGHLGAFVAAPEKSVYVLLPPLEPTAQHAAAVRPAPDVSQPVTGAGRQRSPAAPASIPWRVILLSAWLVATLLLVARLIAMFLYGVHLVRQARRSGCEEIQQAADGTASRLRLITGLQIRTTDRIRSPVVWCWTHPPVLLVPHAPGRGNVEWTGVVAHELAHCKRWDHVTGLVAELTASLMPWNPLMWLSRRFLIRLGEQACDDWVVASGQSSEDYAESLLRFRPQKQMAFWPAVVSSQGGLAHRIRRILNDACGNPCTGVTWALTLGIAVLGISLGVAFAQTRPAPSQAQPEERQETTQSLHHAAKTGDVEVVKKLIAQGADLNEKDKDGSTPLHEAAGNGRRDVARLLLEKGANVEVADASGQTPLHRAARFGSRHICALLLAKGASVNATDSRGNTVLHAALDRQEVDRSLFELLLAKGADVKARNEQGETPLHLACKARRPATYTEQRERAADVLLAHGAEIDATDKSGLTPLHVAVENGQEKVVGLLLAKGADVRTTATDGTTLLHRAVKRGQLDMVELFLNRGIDVNSAQSDGRTALHLAAGTGKNNIVEALIARGADVKARDVRGETPAGLAARSNRKDTVRLLLDKGAEVSTIRIAAYIGDLGAVKGFLERGGNVTAQDKYLTATLWDAALGGQKDVAAFLISKGASVNVEEVGRVRMGALHFAAVGGSKEVAESLIANGAEVNAKADGDATPLYYAAQSGAKDVALLLIDRGADVNAETAGRKSRPLDVAVWALPRDITNLLIDKGADTSHPDDLLFAACAQGDKDLAEFAIQKGANVNSKVWGEEDAPALEAMWSGYTKATKPADIPKLIGILKLLLDKGADADAKDGSDWSLLHYACDNLDLTKFLLDRGANPNVGTKGRDQTPLHFVADQGNRAVTELLLSRGADVNAKDYYGRTPLSYAENRSDEDLWGGPRKTPLTPEITAAKKETAEVLRKHGAKQ